MKARTLSDFVGPNVRHFRELHGWNRPQLVERLEQLGAASLAGTGKTRTGRRWDQVKLLRIESGQRQKIYLEDLAELALALDVSPLELIVPRGDEAQHVHVTVGATIDRPARDVKQWVRGLRPVLGRLDYASDDDAIAGRLFYFVRSQPFGEFDLIRKASTAAARARGALVKPLLEDEEDDAE